MICIDSIDFVQIHSTIQNYRTSSQLRQTGASVYITPRPQIVAPRSSSRCSPASSALGCSTASCSCPACSRPGPAPGAVWRPLPSAVPIMNWFCVVVPCGRAGRLTFRNGAFRQLLPDCCILPTPSPPPPRLEAGQHESRGGERRLAAVVEC
jgi:hypothetical protein